MDERDDYKLVKAKLHRMVLDRLDVVRLGRTPAAGLNNAGTLTVANSLSV
jgi:hypothetical protein